MPSLNLNNRKTSTVEKPPSPSPSLTYYPALRISSKKQPPTLKRSTSYEFNKIYHDTSVEHGQCDNRDYELQGPEIVLNEDYTQPVIHRTENKTIVIDDTACATCKKVKEFRRSMSVRSSLVLLLAVGRTPVTSLLHTLCVLSSIKITIQHRTQETLQTSYQVVSQSFRYVKSFRPVSIPKSLISTAQQGIAYISWGISNKLGVKPRTAFESVMDWLERFNTDEDALYNTLATVCGYPGVCLNYVVLSVYTRTLQYMGFFSRKLGFTSLSEWLISNKKQEEEKFTSVADKAISVLVVIQSDVSSWYIYTSAMPAYIIKTGKTMPAYIIETGKTMPSYIIQTGWYNIARLRDVIARTTSSITDLVQSRGGQVARTTSEDIDDTCSESSGDFALTTDDGVIVGLPLELLKLHKRTKKQTKKRAKLPWDVYKSSSPTQSSMKTSADSDSDETKKRSRRTREKILWQDESLRGKSAPCLTCLSDTACCVCTAKQTKAKSDPQYFRAWTEYTSLDQNMTF